MAHIGSVATAQPDEAVVSASPKGRAVFSRAWNASAVGDTQFQHPAWGRSAKRGSPAFGLALLES
eukprot:4517430-Alexandrium_andersonii.AAC.1